MIWKIRGSARHTVMSNAHGTSSLLLAFSLVLGAAGTAACDSTAEATVARSVPGDGCVIDCNPDPGACVMSPDRWVGQILATPAALTGELCGLSYDEILTAPRDTPWMKMAQQYVTAVANVGHGASLPADVAAAMDDAESFLMGCLPCPGVTSATVPALKTLTRYNVGDLGPDACECVVGCDECVIDCDPDDGLDLCPISDYKLRVTFSY